MDTHSINIDPYEQFRRYREALAEVTAVSVGAARAENLAAVAAERARMLAMHGWHTPAATEMDPRDKLVILTEEVGEVARALAYDHHPDAVQAELVQVAAVALSWLDSLSTSDTEPDPF